MTLVGVFKRCGCRHPATGRQLGGCCPWLRRTDGGWNPTHGRWHYQLELGTGTDGRRRMLRRGGFATATDAMADRDHAARLLTLAKRDPVARHEIGTLLQQATRYGGPLPDEKLVARRIRAHVSVCDGLTVAEYLTDWLGTLRIQPGSRDTYAAHVRDYLIPHLGQIPIDELRPRHIAALQTRLAEHGGVRREELAPATRARIYSTLRKALNDAMADDLISTNPAARHGPANSARSPRPLLWTPARVEAWWTTGHVPGPVMVWTPEQTGAFLDHAADDPLYPLFLLMTHRGLRRGEACGLRYIDVDLDAGYLTVNNQITKAGRDIVHKKPKGSASAGRIVALDHVCREVLANHIQRHPPTAGTNPATDMVFTTPNGGPLDPDTVSRRFRQLITTAELPPIRLHDLRHGAATLALAAGADLKTVQDLLGHSTITVTADFYTSVLLTTHTTTAEAVATTIPRTTRRSQPSSAGLGSGRDGPVREVPEASVSSGSEYAGITTMAQKSGVGTSEPPRQGQVYPGDRPRAANDESTELQRLRWENAELRHAIEILKAASTSFAAEPDGPPPPA